MQNNIYGKLLAISNRHLCQCSDAPISKEETKKYVLQLQRILEHNPLGIILREKDLSEENYTLLSKEVLKATKEYDIPIILHSFIDVAIELKVPYIHLPLNTLEYLSSTPIGQQKLCHFSVIGTGVHSVEEAKKAIQLKADYLLASNIYETECKKGLPGRGLAFLHEVCETARTLSPDSHICVYALGGVNETNAAECMEQGADGFAMMSGAMRL